MKLEFSRQIFENTPIQNFMKIRPVEAELFHEDVWKDKQTNKHIHTHTGTQTNCLADRQTRSKLTVVFRNFANAPENHARYMQSQN